MGNVLHQLLAAIMLSRLLREPGGSPEQGETPATPEQQADIANCEVGNVKTDRGWVVTMPDSDYVVEPWEDFNDDFSDAEDSDADEVVVYSVRNVSTGRYVGVIMTKPTDGKIAFCPFDHETDPVNLPTGICMKHAVLRLLMHNQTHDHFELNSLVRPSRRR